VTIQSDPSGGVLVTNTRTGAQVVAYSDLQIHEFAAAAARSPGGMGAGDAVAAVTSRLGIQKCAPCAKRQAAMNRLVPNVKFWR